MNKICNLNLGKLKEVEGNIDECLLACNLRELNALEYTFDVNFVRFVFILFFTEIGIDLVSEYPNANGFSNNSMILNCRPSLQMLNMTHFTKAKLYHRHIIHIQKE